VRAFILEFLLVSHRARFSLESRLEMHWAASSLRALESNADANRSVRGSTAKTTVVTKT